MEALQEFTIDKDGLLSFSLRDGDWWWYLDLEGRPIYLIGNACGTCRAILSRVRDLKAPIGPDELSRLLAEGLEVVPETVVQVVRPLLPSGRYIAAVLEILPVMETGSRPQLRFGCEADYFWQRVIREWNTGSEYELILPFVPEADLDEGQVARYRERIEAGERPTALALSMVDARDLRGQFPEKALIHFLLDGHHKVMAASQAGRPITILSFLREDSLIGMPVPDDQIRAYYSGKGI